MSTDIYLHVEQRTANGWQAVGNEVDWYDGRSYMLFAALADVRNDGSIRVIAQGRGLPDDLSPEVRDRTEDYWLIYGHAHSWLSYRELAGYSWDGFPPEWADAVKRMGELAGTDPDSVRIVFWFD